MLETDKTAPEVILLDDNMQQFQDLLMANGKNIGPLWKAWHYLQVYSIWGLRLPSNDNALKLALNIQDPMAYSFYESLLNSMSAIHKASHDFSAELFPRVIKVGNSIRSFGEDAGAMEDGTFSAIIELIDQRESKEDVISLITNLRRQAQQNADDAQDVSKELQSYSDRLSEAITSINKANEEIATDTQVSSQEIALLRAGPKVKGSLANLQEMMDASKEEYDQDVIIASTSPTYVWVFPWGTLAAVVVAGVYGDRAVKALDKYDQQRKRYEAMDEALQIAVKTNEVAITAQTGISKAKTYTDFAVEQIDVVQQAWEGLAKSLDLIKAKLDKMTKTVGEKERLLARSRVKNYARRAGEQWRSLWPAIQQLTDDPYITVDAKDNSIADAIQAIQAIQAESTNP